VVGCAAADVVDSLILTVDESLDEFESRSLLGLFLDLGKVKHDG